MAEKQKLFVSYSHADKSICKEITAALEAEGKLNIWFDESLVPGEEYRKKSASDVRSDAIFFNTCYLPRRITFQLAAGSTMPSFSTATSQGFTSLGLFSVFTAFMSS